MPKNPFKYLIVYPFSPLSIAKLFNLIVYTVSIFTWQISPLRSENDFISFLTPFLDLLSIACLLISLWFTLQKFYWRNVEFTFNTIGFVLSLHTVFVLILTDKGHSLIGNIMYNHILTSFGWLFCMMWCRIQTQNTVSNLFIAEWGREVDEIEIEPLQDHF